MAMFRKKTLTQAVQVDGPTFIHLGAAPPPPPVGMSWTWRDGASGAGFQLTIQTKEGLFDVTAKDWRCGPGPEGEFWVVKDGIFRETYEQVVERAPGLHDGCRNPAHSSSGSAFSVMATPKCPSDGCPGVRGHYGPCLPEMENPCPV